MTDSNEKYIIEFSAAVCCTNVIYAQKLHGVPKEEFAPDTVINDGRHVTFEGIVHGLKNGDLCIDLYPQKLVTLKIKDDCFKVSLPVNRKYHLCYLAKNKFIPFRVRTKEIVGDIYKNVSFPKSTISEKEISESVIIRHGKQPRMKMLRRGSQAPDFHEKTADRKDFHLAEAIKHKYVLLNFTALACEGCWMAYPELEQLQKQYQDHLQIVALYGEEASEQRLWEKLALAKSFHKNWQSIWGINSKLSNTYPIKGFPTFFLIAPNGKIVDTYLVFRSGPLGQVLKKEINEVKQ